MPDQRPSCFPNRRRLALRGKASSESIEEINLYNTVAPRASGPGRRGEGAASPRRHWSTKRKRHAMKSLGEECGIDPPPSYKI